MRHNHAGKGLGVSPDHRRAMLRNLTLSLIEHETIKTTPTRAKELRWFADRVVTLAKRGDIHGRRQIVTLLGSTVTNRPGENRVRNAVDRVYTHLVPRYQGRNGGYTQIIRLAALRPGDAAQMCIMRYIPGEEDKKAKGGDKGKKPAKKAPAKDEGKKEVKAKSKEAASDKTDKKSKAPQDKPAKSKKKEE